LYGRGPAGGRQVPPRGREQTVAGHRDDGWVRTHGRRDLLETVEAPADDGDAGAGARRRRAEIRLARRCAELPCRRSGLPPRDGGAGSGTWGARDASVMTSRSPRRSRVTERIRGDAPGASVAQSPLTTPSITAGSPARTRASRRRACWVSPSKARVAPSASAM